MYQRALFASVASICLLANCTPYQENDRTGSSAEISRNDNAVDTSRNATSAEKSDSRSGDVSTPMTRAEANETEAPGPDLNPDFQASQAEGGAGQVDTAIAATYKIRTRSDIAPAVNAMMALADKDEDGQLTRVEFGILAPALALADHTRSGTVTRQGAGDRMQEDDSATPINADEFFTETAGSNGTISRAELTQAITARFNAADADGNGELSQEEARAFAASMRFAQ